MKPQFNSIILFAPGTPSGAERQSAIDRMKQFYAPAVSNTIHIKDVDFGPPVWDAPFSVPLNQGGYGTGRKINKEWYNANVTKYVLKLGLARVFPYHGVVLVLPATQWQGMRIQGNYSDSEYGIAKMYVNGSTMPHSDLYAVLQYEYSHFYTEYLGLKATLDPHMYIENQDSGIISIDILPLFYVTPFFAWWRNVQLTARNRTRIEWRIS